ncbi:TonB-dependent receptor [Methylotenera sp.]|uniref:TonB-dependent receptor n=1 Tax=Methylotenera sp. TaxID=2051956 RepID=UPI002489CC98|nr:TonB-dependent receptor [Methylotenera sp.]MDI1298722.1 TonB-dependent receptor [Methylotenera sp.]
MHNQHQPAQPLLNLKLKPIALVVLLMCAQTAYAQDLNAPEANSIESVTGEPSSKEKKIDVPSIASQYGATKKTLLSAEVKNTNQAGTGKTDSQGKPIDKPVEIELKTVNVRAKRFYQIGPLPGLALTKEEIPGNIQSISAKEIKESHAISLTELMNSKLQSVNVNDYQSNPFQMDVTYRGFTASPQLGTAQGLSVFLDGIRVNEPFGDVVNWDMLPLNALAGIDLIPGSNPIFGLGTLGGAITMRTKSGFDAEEGSVEALGGSFNRKQFQGSIGGNNGVVAGFAAFNLFGEDGWRDDSPSKVNQVFGKAEWRNENLQFGLSALYAGNKLTGNGLLPTEMAQQDRSQVFTSADETKNKLLQFQFTGQWDVSETFNITGQVYKRKSKRNSRTGDVNENISGGATRRPLAGEQLTTSYPDLDNDGLPDPDLSQSNILNVAVDALGSYLDTSGNAAYIDDGTNTGNYIDNPAFDINNLAVGTNFNTALFANQGTQDYFDVKGNYLYTAPSWTTNPNAVPTAGPSEDWKRKAREIWLSRNAIGQTEKLLDKYFPVQSRDAFYTVSGPSGTFTDANGFTNYISYNAIFIADLPATFPGSNYGLGKPAGILVRDPITGQPIERNGADCTASESPTGIAGQCAGYVEGTPTALITETEIDQTTDGGAVQLNWNLEHHKLMIGASVDAADASYTSGQYLGLFDNKRKAYLDPANIGYEFAAASTKFGLNDFSGNSVTKSVYLSDTWSPVKAWNFTGAARYNVTNMKNELAINNYLGLLGPTAFKNFIESFQLCKDLNNDGTVTADECPAAEYVPFSLERAQGLGAIGKGETEKFTYRSFNPSLGATWQPYETLNVYGNWNQGARTPSVIELGCAYDGTLVPVTFAADGITPTAFRPRSLQERRFCSLPSTLSGDPYLKQVRSQTMEFGARGYLTPDIQWNAAVYNTDLKDDIYFVSFTPDRSFFQNIGKTRRRGLEMGLQGKSGKAGFRLNYSLTDATFQESFSVASPNNSSAGNVGQSDSLYARPTGYQQIRVHPGNRMPGVPLHNLNATFTYDLTQDWTVGLTAVMHSDSFIRGNENNKHQAGASNPVYSCGTAGSSIKDGDIEYADSSCTIGYTRPSSRFPGKVPGYAVFNFNTTYKITKGLTAGLQVSNVFNREYYSAGRLGINAFSPSINGAIGAGGFNYNSNDWQSTTFLAPGAPRSAYVSLTYDFDLGSK